MEEKPLVTVIIPNYNHERYLRKRIDSVLNQSVGNLEVLILDDCSTDNSRSILHEYAVDDSRIKLVFNNVNSGSTFKQWNKGFSLASGEYIWIAESDDYADEFFLEKTLKYMLIDKNIGICYSDSWSVDKDDKIYNEWKENLKYLDPNLWEDDFVMDGIDLVRKYMVYKNIIPNASAVLFRKDIVLKVGNANEKLKVLGDWDFWMKILAICKIAYVSEPLNFFRSHSNNVRSKYSFDGTIMCEISDVMVLAKGYDKINNIFYKKSIDHLLSIWFASLAYKENYISFDKHKIVISNLLKMGPVIFERFLLSTLRFLRRKIIS